MENPRHREAFVLFSAQSGKRRSEYVVDCILRVQDENSLEDTIRRVIAEAFKEIPFSASATESRTADLRATERLSDLPGVLLASLDEI